LLNTSCGQLLIAWVVLVSINLRKSVNSFLQQKPKNLPPLRRDECPRRSLLIDSNLGVNVRSASDKGAVGKRGSGPHINYLEYVRGARVDKQPLVDGVRRI
jgi:hypothetical protein